MVYNIRYIILISIIQLLTLNVYCQEYKLIPPYPERIDSLLNQEDVYAYTIVEQQPYFSYINGKGFIESYWRYLQDSLRYPSSDGCHGQVFVEFIVEKDGTLNNIHVIKGISNCPEYSEYNKEAIRILLYMPKWTAGKIATHNVRVRMIMPVVFN